jgi:hypothetical protein
LTGLAVAVFVLATAQPAPADSIAFTFPDPPVGTPSAQGNDGFQFQPTFPILVTALGYYNRAHPADLTLNHPVGIFDVATQALLTSTTVGPGSTLDGNFRYNAIAPLALIAGQSYMVVGFHPGSATQDLAAATPPGLTIAPEITFQGYFLNFNSSLTFPTTNGGNTRFFGPNFQFQVIPEPTSLALFGLGAVGLLSYGWRWRKQARFKGIIA